MKKRITVSSSPSRLTSAHLPVLTCRERWQTAPPVRCLCQLLWVERNLSPLNSQGTLSPSVGFIVRSNTQIYQMITVD